MFLIRAYFVRLVDLEKSQVASYILETCIWSTILERYHPKPWHCEVGWPVPFLALGSTFPRGTILSHGIVG